MKAYLKGLPADMMVMVNSRAFTLVETIEEAKVLESVYAKRREERMSSGEKRKCEGPYQKAKPLWKQQSRNPPQSRDKMCGKPGHTRNECPIKGPTCFECGEPGHFKNDCPKRKAGGSQTRKENTPRAAGRAFQMTAKEAIASTDVVSGTFLVNSVPAHVLFDSGASCSFVSNAFYQHLCMPPSALEDALIVEIANDSRVLVRKIVRGYVLEIEGKEIPKLIRIALPDGNAVLIHGERKQENVMVLSVAKARKCLAKGCPSFIAYVLDTKLEKGRIRDVKVVNEFLDVFPEDLPGLPLDRQVEFQIDLVPGTAPIARAPYRLAPFEMQELMSQLQDLIENVHRLQGAQ
ncbi:uncharacterized protein LOC112510795 [Cynara cardunculus var. scolymus]|uniref:uncharacterized protein LOC112510795 n=1 Tax=Cynara cardunculus var. scolymus TaxID=59895 RepID=UPI000D62BCD5|nr:uncharacterized protein LOC112510795 [Cynara cardunculus var. scolymus]